MAPVTLRLLAKAMRCDIQFLARHPTTLFQCLWNRCWWYDCPEAAAHYDPPSGGWPAEGPPWSRPRPIGCPRSSKPGARRRRGVPPASPGSVPSARPAGPRQSPLACLHGHADQVFSVAYSPMAAASSPGRGTGRCGCGMRTAAQSWPASAAMRAGSVAWRIPPTAAASPPGRRTRRCGCGMRTAARSWPASADMRARSIAWRIRPTAAASSPGRRTRRCGYGMRTAARSWPASAGMRARSGA